MTNHFKLFEYQAEEWYRIYIKSIEIVVDSFEHEYFVEKWHHNIPWNADPVKVAGDCNNALLSFREFQTKFETIVKKTSRYLTYPYFRWDNGIRVSSLVESTDHHRQRLLERGIRI